MMSFTDDLERAASDISNGVKKLCSVRGLRDVHLLFNDICEYSRLHHPQANDSIQDEIQLSQKLAAAYLVSCLSAITVNVRFENSSKSSYLDKDSNGCVVPDVTIALRKIERMMERVRAAKTLCNSGIEMTPELVLAVLKSLSDDRRDNGLGHVTAGDDGVVWKAWYLQLNADQPVFLAPRNDMVADDHNSSLENAAYDDVQSIMCHGGARIRDAISKFLLGERGSLQQIESNMLLRCKIVAFAVAGAMARMPQYDASDVWKIWNYASKRLSQDSRLDLNRYSLEPLHLSVDAIQDSTAASVFPDWTCFTKLEPEANAVTKDTFALFFHVWDWHFSVKRGPKSLHKLPLMAFLLARVAINCAVIRVSVDILCSLVMQFSEINNVVPIEMTENNWNVWFTQFKDKLIPKHVGVSASFQQEYVNGEDSVNAFVHYVKAVSSKKLSENNLVNLYAPFFPIIQSSGTGKSRLIREAILRMPVLYICLRKLYSSTGVPPRSPNVAEYLVNPKNASSGAYEKFFLRLMLVFYNELLIAQNSSIPNVNVWFNLSTMLFNTELTSNNDETTDGSIGTCREFWEFVCGADLSFIVETMKTSLESIDNPFCKTPLYVPGYTHALDLSSAPPSQTDASVGAPGSTNTTAIDNAVAFVTAAINLAFPDNILPVLIAVDEASSLLPEKADISLTTDAARSAAGQATNFFAFRKATQAFWSLLVVTVLDTSSSLWNFSPLSKEDGSFRLMQKEFVLADPFYRLPYPQDLKMHDNCRVITDIADAAGLAPTLHYNRFEMILTSRPLFHGIVMMTSSINKQNLWDELTNVAALKLVGAYTDKSSTISDQHCLAIFGARCPIAPNNIFTAHGLISGHMAILREVNADRTFARIEFQADSLLAEASARIMNTRGAFDILLAHLTSLVRCGTVAPLGDRGSFGEFAACILIARAFDKALPELDTLSEVLLAHESMVFLRPVLPQFSPSMSAETTLVHQGPSEGASDTGLITQEPSVGSLIAANLSAAITGLNEFAISPKMTDIDVADDFSKFENANLQPVEQCPSVALTIEKNHSPASEVSRIKRPHAGRPVTVETFLRSLLPRAYHLALRNATNDPLMRSMMGGWIRCLQFIQNSCNIVTPDMMRVAWRRHYAIHTSDTHAGCDVIVPVMQLIGPGDCSLSGIFVEVENRESSVTPKEHRLIVGKLLRAARAVIDNGPIVLLVMHLSCTKLPKFEQDGITTRGGTDQPVRAVTVNGLCEWPLATDDDMFYNWVLDNYDDDSDAPSAKRIKKDPDSKYVVDNDSDTKFKAALKMATTDVLLVSCFGCGPETYGSFMTPGQLELISSVSGTSALDIVDISEGKKRYGKNSNEMKNWISAIAIGNSKYYSDLKNNPPKFDDSVILKHI